MPGPTISTGRASSRKRKVPAFTHSGTRPPSAMLANQLLHSPSRVKPQPRLPPHDGEGNRKVAGMSLLQGDEAKQGRRQWLYQGRGGDREGAGLDARQQVEQVFEGWMRRGEVGEDLTRSPALSVAVVAHVVHALC